MTGSENKCTQIGTTCTQVYQLSYSEQKQFSFFKAWKIHVSTLQDNGCESSLSFEACEMLLGNTQI